MYSVYPFSCLITGFTFSLVILKYTSPVLPSTIMFIYHCCPSDISDAISYLFIKRVPITWRESSSMTHIFCGLVLILLFYLYIPFLVTVFQCYHIILLFFICYVIYFLILLLSCLECLWHYHFVLFLSFEMWPYVCSIPRAF